MHGKFAKAYECGIGQYEEKNAKNDSKTQF
jgi:hypothetical protein